MPQALAAIPMIIANAAVAATTAITGSVVAGTVAGNFALGLFGVGGAGIAGFLGSASGAALLTAGMNALQPKPATTQAQLQTTVGSIGPRTQVVGRTAVAGQLLTPTPLLTSKDRLSTMFYALSGSGPCGVVEKVIWGQESVTFDASGNAIGKYADAMWTKQSPGSWTQNALTFDADQPSEWTSNHRGRGCLMFGFRIKGKADVFGGAAQTPAMVVDANQIECIDPRTGVAATSTAQRRNPAVIAYTFLLGWYSPDAIAPGGVGKKLIGLGLPASQIDTAWFAYWAGVCDTNGWTVAGEISAAANAYAVLAAIMQSGAASPIERYGLASGIVSAPTAISATITEDDLAGPPVFRSAADRWSLPTHIIPRFRHEPAQFDFVDGTAVTDADWLTARGGKEFRKPIAYEFCGGGAAQAGQLAGYDGYNAQEKIAVTIPLKPQARYKALVGDCVALNLPTWGVTGLKVRLLKVSVGADLQGTWEAISDTDSKHAKALGKTTTPTAYTYANPFDETAVPTPEAGQWTATATTITADGTTLPIIRVTGSADDYGQVAGIVVRYRLDGTSPWLSEQILNPDATQAEITGLTPGTAYEIGVAYQNQLGTTGPALVLTAVTTGGFVAGSAASVDVDNIGGDTSQILNLPPGISAAVGGNLVLIPNESVDGPNAGEISIEHPVGQVPFVTHSTAGRVDLTVNEREILTPAEGASTFPDQRLFVIFNPTLEWRNRHAGLSTDASPGRFGIATYDRASGQWGAWGNTVGPVAFTPDPDDRFVAVIYKADAATQITGLQTLVTTTMDAQDITVSTGTTAPTDPEIGDIWRDSSTDPVTRKIWTGTAWEPVGTVVTSTSDIADGAGLGNTASWPNVTGAGRPADNATVGADWTSNLANRPGNLASLAGAEDILNANLIDDIDSAETRARWAQLGDFPRDFARIDDEYRGTWTGTDVGSASATPWTRVSDLVARVTTDGSNQFLAPDAWRRAVAGERIEFAFRWRVVSGGTSGTEILARSFRRVSDAGVNLGFESFAGINHPGDNNWRTEIASWTVDAADADLFRWAIQTRPGAGSGVVIEVSPIAVRVVPETLAGVEPNADVTATAQRVVQADVPAIEIRAGQAGAPGQAVRTVPFTAKRGTATLTGGTWSLVSSSVGTGTAIINSSTGVVTLDDVDESGSLLVRYTHTDTIATDGFVNVTWFPAVSGAAFAVTANPVALSGSGGANTTITTGTSTLTTANATGSVSIFWEDVSGFGASPTAGSNSSSVAFELTPSLSGTYDAIMRGTAVDSATGQIAILQITATFTAT